MYAYVKLPYLPFKFKAQAVVSIDEVLFKIHGNTHTYFRLTRQGGKQAEAKQSSYRVNFDRHGLDAPSPNGRPATSYSAVVGCKLITGHPTVTDRVLWTRSAT